ncbi:hypothetical protein FUAX_04870 [Fulvitalea axinellae]|uniref:Lipocalin-like domain-containing protein n=1 Tax=Fulvitalea axinellae TaxID=1182444 RepID=A0AAU9D7A1_9BACT|nr:hypothetical protein FUAX_04870 [Fulvitalea axinellae]
MSKLRFLPLLLMLIGLFSCDDNDEINPDELSGTWSVSAVNFDATASLGVLGNNTEVMSAKFKGQNIDITMVFSEDPYKYTLSGNIDLKIEEYTPAAGLEEEFPKDQLKESFDAMSPLQDTGTWSRKGKGLIFTSDAIPDATEASIISLSDGSQIEIKSLDEEMMVLKVDVASSNEMEAGTVTTKGTMTIIMDKMKQQ